MKKFTKTLILSKGDMKLINNYFSSPYPGSHEPRISFTVKFDNGNEFDIIVQPTDSESEPYIDTILYNKDGSELAFTDVYDKFQDSFEISYNNDTYIVNIDKEEK